MGSFFLHDDYRLPDISSFGLKKDTTNNGGTNAFNPCIANIKRELGFYDEVIGSDTGQQDGRDIGHDTRARSSPVVDRLILQEIQSEVAESASHLNIPIDPERWSINDTRRWLTWLSTIYQLNIDATYLEYDGPSLCNRSERELELLTGSRDAALKILAQLDIWRNACKMVPSSGFYVFQQQQAMDQRYSGNNRRFMENQGPKLMNTSWSAPEGPMPIGGSSPCSGYPQNRGYPQTTFPPKIMRQHSTPAPGPACTQYMPDSYPRQMIPERYPNHHRAAMPGTGNFNRSSCNLPPELLRRTSEMYMSQQQQQQHLVVNPVTQPQPLNELYCTEGSEQPTVEKLEQKPEPYNSCSAMESELPVMNSDVHIKKEVVQTCEKKEKELDNKTPKTEPGVFKIFNSQQVAKLWGERKIRPAMNYDKLSRSIRQYYKKGIIKKTTQGKRLVYQFCEAYL